MRQITDEKFEELYEQFQKQKKNLGSDTEFAEFLNKKKMKKSFFSQFFSKENSNPTEQKF